MDQQFDVVIVGGGMVGAALGCALAGTGMSIAVLENKPPAPFTGADEPLDLRVSAINLHSERVLELLGAWPLIRQMRLCPFKRMAVSESGGSTTRFAAEEIHVGHLGHIIENRVIQLALWQQLQTCAAVTIICPAEVTAIQTSEDGVALSLAGGDTLRASLLVGADGAASVVREAAGIGLTGWQYDQHVLVVNIRTAAAQQDITWQEFHPAGPRAFLPLPGQHGSLVWYDKPGRVRALLQMPDNQLQRAIRDAFPAQLGEFEVEQKGRFALSRRHANRYCKGPVVILGDAAHTINPMAGQGVNLGFKDVEVLADVLSLAYQGREAWNSPAVLRRYQQRRMPDNLLMQGAMDAFYLAFGNDLEPVRRIRNLGLALANRAGPLKRQVLRYATGV